MPNDNVVFSTGQHLVNSPTPTLDVYRGLFADPFFRADLSLTLWITVSSVVLVAIVGYVLALYVRFGSGRVPRLVRSLYLIPMFVPVVIASYAAITFYVDRGVLASALHAARPAVRIARLQTVRASSSPRSGTTSPSPC